MLKLTNVAVLGLALALALGLAFTPALRAAEAAAGEASGTVDWKSWHAGNDVSNLASLQRGARNFSNYCLACHSMKYLRWSRVGQDLKIAPAQLSTDLIPAGAGPADYIQASVLPEDGVAWFGKEPPDLSLIARLRGPDYLYRFLKTFYLDPSRATRSNNLALDSPAMPAVLSELEGVKAAVFKNAGPAADGKPSTAKVFDHFTSVVPGRLNEAQYDAFVRDTVNFLDYAGEEPAPFERRSIGIWVVLFLLVFTGIAWLLKNEYWKDVH